MVSNVRWRMPQIQVKTRPTTELSLQKPGLWMKEAQYKPSQPQRKMYNKYGQKVMPLHDSTRKIIEYGVSLIYNKTKTKLYAAQINIHLESKTASVNFCFTFVVCYDCISAKIIICWLNTKQITFERCEAFHCSTWILIKKNHSTPHPV